ncbi:protein FAM43A [Sceloporus undulatus]|uniref:protein FAM43A n=1 Tax=Sceloporus undulatus TaxID=8520 RepID=UPI001C4BFE6B|nr:protein FAM43A [Sceloporus undulatus]
MRLPGLLREPPAESPDPSPAPPPAAAMLPWKRHKFAVSPGGGGGPSPGSPSSASVSSSVSSSAGSLSGVGRLLGWRRRRRSFPVSREAPVYSGLYLGNAGTLQAKGQGCTEGAVGKIWARSQAGRLGSRMRLWLAPQGLRLAPAQEPPAPQQQQQLYLLHRLTHCAADARLPRLLAWVYRHEGRHKAVVLRCHAVLLPKAAQARALALRLGQASADALQDFRRLKKRSDARRQHLLHLQRHLGPAGKGLLDAAEAEAPANRHTASRAPGQRSRSAPRLAAIAEDPLGEEEEEEEGRLARGLRRMGLANHADGPRTELPRGSRSQTQ